MLAADDDLLRPTETGLSCPAGDFTIDPRGRVGTAVITHAHGDHLRRGSGRYLCAAPSLPLLRERLPRGVAIEARPYGEAFRLGGVTVSFHPAGHILGSAQVRVQRAGGVGATWVASGDFKRQPDPTCAPFEVVPCDVFVTEATFADPNFVFPEGHDVAREIHAWWEANAVAGRASLLYCYALGKAQRILAELAALLSAAPAAAARLGTILVHPAFVRLNALYAAAGVRLAQAEDLALVPRERATHADLVLLPPAMIHGRPLRRFRAAARAFASGWMVQPEAAQARGLDRGFVLSDHADFPALLRTILETGARRVVAVHGAAAALVEPLAARGVAVESWRVQEFPAS